MQNALRSARIAQTRGAYELLNKEIDTWIQGWTGRDAIKEQYHTQLTTLNGILRSALQRLQERLDSLSVRPTLGDLFRACDDYEIYLLWIRQVWDYFRVKFDQRCSTSASAPLLKAADEVVWSCYTPVFQHKYLKAANLAPGPVPLPYIDIQATPAALPRDSRGTLPAAMLASPVMKELEAYLTSLPIPVVRLPHNCLDAPWWLIFIGHEVGHHVHHDLMPDKGLVKRFGALLQEIGQRTGSVGNDAEQEGTRWEKWREELFADIFAAYSFGPPAGSAMAWLERAEDVAMWQERADETYPPVGLRLEFIARLGDALMSGEAPEVQNAPASVPFRTPEARLIQALLQVEPFDSKTPAEDGADTKKSIETEAIRADRARMKVLIQKLRTEPLFSTADLPLHAGAVPGRETASQKEKPVFIADCCPFLLDEFLPMGKVTKWRDALTQKTVTRAPETRIESARLVLAGGAAAWAKAILLPDDGERTAALDCLRDNLPKILVQSAATGRRAAAPALPLPRLEELGQEMAEILFNAEGISGRS